MGVHREEALARFAGFELELSYSETDFLAMLAHGLDVTTRTHTERYMRLTLGFSEGRRGMLARVNQARVFNALGQVTQVRSEKERGGAGGVGWAD